MAAITPAAAVAPIPGMVMIRRTSGQERTRSAMVRSTRLSSVFRNSTWRRLACTVSRSSAGRSWSPSQARPRLPNRSLAGGRPFNVRWSTAWIWFLARVRCLMSWACRDTRRRRSRVRSSPSHTPGRNPAASSLARVRASSRSVFALADAIARTAMGLAITTRPGVGLQDPGDGQSPSRGLQDDVILRPQALPEHLQVLRRRADPGTGPAHVVLDDSHLAEVLVDVESDEPHRALPLPLLG